MVFDRFDLPPTITGRDWPGARRRGTRI